MRERSLQWLRLENLLAPMEKQEQQDSIDLKLFHNPSDQMHVDMKTCPISNLHSKEIGSAGKALRVRKPYTITKQRERWTEEEHKKFLEAVQLYGRAWRQIEEYIGSKTTVQIRSHAQKFFSKVINQTGTTENMEIPPPRPKKKPAHPYPRKLGNLSTKGARAKQFEKPPLLISAICEQDNGSLTSVLLAGGSEAPGCSSLVASAADSSDQDDAGQSPDVEAEEDHKLPYDGSPAPGITIQNQPQMDIDQRSAVHNSSEAQVTTLKLFGKMLMVTDSNKPSAPCTGNEAEPAQASSPHRVDNREEKAFKLRFKPEMSLQSHTQAGNACAGGGVRPAIDCFPFVGDNSVEPTTFLRPWWAMCGNIFSPFINSKPQYPLQPSTEPVQREGPWTGSNTAASCVVDDTDGAFCSKAGNLDENVQMHCSILKAIRTPVSKSWTGASETGFIPWRSCAAESEVHHSATVGEDGENQAVRLRL